MVGRTVEELAAELRHRGVLVKGTNPLWVGLVMVKVKRQLGRFSIPNGKLYVRIESLNSERHEGETFLPDTLFLKGNRPHVCQPNLK